MEKKIELNRITDADHDILFEQRESVSERTPYATEKLLLSAIRRGDRQTLSDAFDYMASNRVPSGNLSGNDLRQARYMGVALITLATRAAIEEGMPEAEAFSLSDECILSMDRQREPEAVLHELFFTAELFLERISACKNRYSDLIKSAMDYVSSHLHGDVSLPAAARYCGVSPAYLSRCFKDETGERLHEYILRVKLEEARSLLSGKRLSCAAVSSTLGFSSQSHFTACFRRRYGITPAKFRRSGSTGQSA